MTTLKRAFIAIDLPAPVVDELGELVRVLKKRVEGFRWVKLEPLHLTLKFIGGVEPEKLDRIAVLVENGFEGPGEALNTGGPIELHTEGVGAFPSPGRARVIWAGLGGEVGRLSRLALGVEARLEALGIERERRPFKPHLTLGRARGRACNLTRAMSEQRQFMGGPWRAKSLMLYESELLGGGAKHTPRAEYKLDRT